MTQDEAIHQLLYAIVGAAKDMHEHHERLVPFGAALFPNGEIKLAAASPENPDAPDDEFEQMLIAGFRGQKSEIAAAGWACDVRIQRGEETDALRIHLEHKDGGTALVYLPYERGGAAPTYGELFRVPAEPRVFGEHHPPSNVSSSV